MHTKITPSKRAPALRRDDRAMSTSEVAQRYFPHAVRASAVRQLRRWIDSDPPLQRELAAAGVRRGQRFYSPRQVRIFERWLGRG